MVQWVQEAAGQNTKPSSWFVYGEHTGLYGLGLARFLEQNRIPYLLDSPLRISRSLGLKRQKDDPADAQDIARCAMRRDFGQKVRPIPAMILMKAHTLLSLRHRLVRYRVGLQVAAKELAFAAGPAISQPIEDSTEVVRETIAGQIKECERQIAGLLNCDGGLGRLYGLVKSVVGIGPVITAYLLVYTNGFTAFDNARQFNCFIGTAPFKYRSGTSIRQKDRVNSMANHKLKALFSMAAVTAVNHDPQIRAFFNRSLERGKEEPWIYNAIKAKLVKRVFAVVHRGSPYVVLDKHLN
jgi:transposase